MISTAPFKIYNASAGSGKTFTLVKEYLLEILRSKNEGYYQHVLAITFTNKAVAEMKQRIIESLVAFSKPETLQKPPHMMLQIASELNLSVEEIQLQSKKILKHLLHHYAGFSVETIDRFNHRLIRTFARDLHLATNFEVSLDTPQLLAEAVDQLINNAGNDPEVTKVLLDFVLEKTDDDKSWDIATDITKAAKLLFVENDAVHLEKLKEKSLEDFTTFKKQLVLKKKGFSEKIVKTANDTLQLIEESGLQFNDFSGGYLPKHFQNLALEKFDLNFSLKWQENIDDKPLYPKRVDASIASIIDELAQDFKINFEISKNWANELLLIESILKNLTPLFVINLVNKELDVIKEEKNIVPISEFNALINKEIKDQPAPFVYERLGEKYRHFFIDEFQDTSKLQWENLIPLIDNAVSQETGNDRSGSLFIVGDAKQSIYRWRGGLPEQFMNLYGPVSPFLAVEKTVLNLPVNYRSCEEIIDFNNQFFSMTATYFGDPVHKELYETGNKQNLNDKKNGYVKIEFIEKQNKAEKDEVYGQKIYETITHLTANGFNKSDVCILTRSKKDGIFLGGYLMERGVSVISSETLLIQSSSLVQCIVNTLTVSVFTENEEAVIALLDFLHEHLSVSEEKHTFFSHFLKISRLEFEEKLKNYGLNFSFKTIQSLSLYESCEYCIRELKLKEKADAYLFSFMDLIFEFEQQSQATKLSFLEYWELHKEKASIPANENTDAVQLMTIHKAKGLEFPVVLFPFADVKLYDAKLDTIWYPLEKDAGYSFDEAQINFKKELANYSVIGEKLYNVHRQTLELDNINLLYVTLTRAVEQLYIFAEEPGKTSGEGPSNYNQLFAEYLKNKGLWEDGKPTYEFGKFSPAILENNIEKATPIIPKYIATTPADHQLKIVTTEAALWDTEAQIAITEGNVLHDIMAEINSVNDIAPFFENLQERSIFSMEEFTTLQHKVNTIVMHPKLKHLFEDSAIVKNERDIITASGMLLRPDRLNFHTDNSVTITDYKTGTPNYHHEDQINSYAMALEEMGKKVSEKLLVYTNQQEILINKV